MINNNLENDILNKLTTKDKVETSVMIDIIKEQPVTEVVEEVKEASKEDEKWVIIGRVGQFADEEGNIKEFTPDIYAEAVATFDNEVPVQLNHNLDPLNKRGTIKDIKFENNNVAAKIEYNKDYTPDQRFYPSVGLVKVAGKWFLDHVALTETPLQDVRPLRMVASMNGKVYYPLENVIVKQNEQIKTLLAAKETQVNSLVAEKNTEIEKLKQDITAKDNLIAEKEQLLATKKVKPVISEQEIKSISELHSMKLEKLFASNKINPVQYKKLQDTFINKLEASATVNSFDTIYDILDKTNGSTLDVMTADLSKGVTVGDLRKIIEDTHVDIETKAISKQYLEYYEKQRNRN
jgi:hypothetical protein